MKKFFSVQFASMAFLALIACDKDDTKKDSAEVTPDTLSTFSIVVREAENGQVIKCRQLENTTAEAARIISETLGQYTFITGNACPEKLPSASASSKCYYEKTKTTDFYYGSLVSTESEDYCVVTGGVYTILSQ
ncbi:MAG: hypothetical protein M3Q07_10940 [Pseudobdellovibrionaceae bacterium]|nr:hypothetical protein [Pseudobdellovibrionaceae bacterium]